MLHRNLVQAVQSALEDIFNENKYADKALERALKQNPRWGARDRKFIAETTYEMVRWHRLLSEISCSHTRNNSVHVSAFTDSHKERFWQNFGAHLILNKQELPPWDELKNISPEKIMAYYEQLKPVRKIRESIPDWLDEKGEKELGEKWETELHALNEQANVVLRVNKLKISKDELQKKLAANGIETIEPGDTEKWGDVSLLLKKRCNLFQTQEFKEGLFELQDASSQMVVPFLRAEPGMRVIDACAGAGGKTLHIAAGLKNKGKIIALDTEYWKLDELRKRARRAGANNIETKIIDSNKVIKRLHNSAERLLLDVPCSGTGVLKRNPDAKWKLSPDYIEKVKTLQQEILQHYSSMLKAGGIMVYATCSIFPSENEKQVERFLQNNAGRFTLLEEKTILPSQGFDGFYMAAMRKSFVR